MICDAPLNANANKEPEKDYYNFTVIANAEKSSSEHRKTAGNKHDIPSLGERRVTANQSIQRKIPENLKLNNSIGSDSAPSPSLSTSSGPYIAISECISGNPLIDRENPMTPLNSLDPKFYDTPRSHFNIGLNLTNDQPYSPKRNNIPTVSDSNKLDFLLYFFHSAILVCLIISIFL